MSQNSRGVCWRWTICGESLSSTGYGTDEDRARARAHPDRLVVGRPVHDVVVARFLQQIGRAWRSRTRPAPSSLSARLPSLRVKVSVTSRITRASSSSQRKSCRFSELVRPCATISSPRLRMALEDLRRVVVEQAVGVVRERHLQLVGEIEEPPDADAVAVVAPRVVALRLRLAVLRVVVAAALAEREALDVGGDAEREALAAGPAVVLALGERANSRSGCAAAASGPWESCRF